MVSQPIQDGNDSLNKNHDNPEIVLLWAQLQAIRHYKDVAEPYQQLTAELWDPHRNEAKFFEVG